MFCTGWQVSLVSSITGTVSVENIVTAPYNNLIKKDGFYLSTGSGSTTSGLVVTGGNITGTGAYEITIKKGDLMVGTFFEFRAEINFLNIQNTGNYPLKVYIHGIINFNTLQWTAANVFYPYGNPNSSLYNFRFGDDGTDLKIWIGELNSAFYATNLTTGIQILNIWSYNSSTVYPTPVFNQFVARNTWNIKLQSTAFGNIDISKLISDTPSIPFSSRDKHNYSSNFVYDNTNTRLGIGTSTPAYSLDITSTNAIKLPTGTTAQRPTAVQGLLRYNTSTIELDVHDGTNWRRVIDIADTNASTGDVVSFTGTAYAAVSQRRGLTTLTTDASGDITLSITMPDATYSAVAIPDGQTFYVITAHTKTTSSVKFRIYDSTGNIVPSGTSVSINYNITDY